MAKPNPIRILRGLLRSEDDPITQAQFSKLTNIPLDSIRNLETDRRILTETHLRKILASLGAQWDQERERWHLARTPDVPYTAGIYQMFSTRQLDSKLRRRVEIHMLIRRLIELFIQVEPEDYQRLFYQIFNFLDDLRVEFRINNARKIYEKTRFEINAGIPQQPGTIGFIARNYPHMNDEELVLIEGKGRERHGLWWDFTFLDEQLPEVEGT